MATTGYLIMRYRWRTSFWTSRVAKRRRRGSSTALVKLVNRHSMSALLFFHSKKTFFFWTLSFVYQKTIKSQFSTVFPDEMGYEKNVDKKRGGCWNTTLRIEFSDTEKKKEKQEKARELEWYFGTRPVSFFVNVFFIPHFIGKYSWKLRFSDFLGGVVKNGGGLKKPVIDDLVCAW